MAGCADGEETFRGALRPEPAGLTHVQDGDPGFRRQERGASFPPAAPQGMEGRASEGEEGPWGSLGQRERSVEFRGEEMAVKGRTPPPGRAPGALRRPEGAMRDPCAHAGQSSDR